MLFFVDIFFTVKISMKLLKTLIQFESLKMVTLDVNVSPGKLYHLRSLDAATSIYVAKFQVTYFFHISNNDYLA